MRSRDTRAFQALRRVDDWTDAHPTLVPVEVQPQIANLKSVTAAVADLEQQAVALKQVIDSRGQIRGSVVGATQGLKAQLLAGRKTVHLLDVTLSRVLRNDPSELASWKNAKRVTLKGVLPKAGAVTPAGSPGTTPVIPIAPAVGAPTPSAAAVTAGVSVGTKAG